MCFFLHFLNLALYGSWEPLDSAKRLSRGVGTFCPPGKPMGTTFIFWFVFITFRDVQLFRTLQPISQPISAHLIHFQLILIIFQHISTPLCLKSRPCGLPFPCRGSFRHQKTNIFGVSSIPAEREAEGWLGVGRVGRSHPNEGILYYLCIMRD